MSDKPDIVERLRGEHWWLNVDGNEAADEIEWLRSIARDWMKQRQDELPTADDVRGILKSQ